ncbi:serine acetyltransferase [Pantoea coffeiphila]|uniref:Serine acetyltransferase n=1 Tax=Pantoea coffeiphila TaxID=1465635 RepID=A0A2S9IG73_9GAMM|nr:serine acetyltransferase [Pantoea coffeiphila]PRD16791.1 serine acetyltransferase [Pantoea coffeiphila]
MSNWFGAYWREVKKNPTLKSKIIITLFRFSSLFFSKRKNPLKYLFVVFVMLYYAIVEFLWGVEIKPKTKIGWGLVIYHPVAIIINPGSILGEDIILRHGITIGNKYNRKTAVETANPVVGDRVDFGAHACVLGPIKIGDDCVIGAMAYVDFDVDAITVVVAHRGIVLRKKND